MSKFIHKELRMEHMFAFGDVNTASGKAVVAKAICQAVKQKSAESNSSSHVYTWSNDFVKSRSSPTDLRFLMFLWM